MREGASSRLWTASCHRYFWKSSLWKDADINPLDIPKYFYFYMTYNSRSLFYTKTYSLQVLMFSLCVCLFIYMVIWGQEFLERRGEEAAQCCPSAETAAPASAKASGLCQTAEGPWACRVPASAPLFHQGHCGPIPCRGKSIQGISKEVVREEISTSGAHSCSLPRHARDPQLRHRREDRAHVLAPKVETPFQASINVSSLVPT